MEEKRNSAFDKAENIANGNKGETQVKSEKQREKSKEEIREEMKLKKAKEMIAYNRERNRIEAEKEERKAEMQAAKEAREDALKKQKYIAKKEMRMQREKDKMLRKERNRGLGGWITAVVSLGIATLVLASVLTFTFLTPSARDNMLESAYRQSFYDTVEQVDNMDLNMSKALYSKDQRAVQTYLTDLAVNSELALSDLHSLPLEDESKYYTTKIVNQTGDYAKYLNKKLINGESITEEERQNLGELYKAVGSLKASLQKIMSEMKGDYSFYTLTSGNKDFVIENFEELENLSVEFPELIYDGPFSDGLDGREIKGLTGSDIDEERAVEIFREIFGSEGITDIESSGSVEGDIPCYAVQGEMQGEELYAQISVKGGKLINFSYSGSCKQVKFNREDAEEVGLRFLTALGIEDMKAVWINLSNNLYTINYVKEQNGIIIYSDMIKIRVCAETLTVIGYEAQTYYYNHTEREIPQPSISETVARDNVVAEMDVLTGRLAICPIGEKSEKLCYEFSGLIGETTYYVYIDAESGRQIQMFKVIESTEGLLLM